MTRLFALSLLFFTVTAHAQYVYEDVINAERFGHLQLNNPWGVSIGKNDGRIYVVDQNNRIVIVNSDGSNYSAIETSGYDEWGGYPTSVFVDNGGKIYVGINGQVLVFNIDGTLHRTMGSFGSGEGQLFYPYGISVDSFGNVFVADLGNNRVTVFSNEGAFLYSFAKIDEVSGFFYPSSIAIDALDNVYVSDYANQKIIKFSGSGEFISSMSTPTPYPWSISIDSESNIYVLGFSFHGNTFGSSISMYSQAGELLHTFNGWDGNDLATFYSFGIAAKNETEVYVTDLWNRILKLDLVSNQIIEVVKSSNNGQTNSPVEISQDLNGNVFVVDGVNDLVQVFDFKGDFLRKFAINSEGAGSFPYNYKMAIDQNGWSFILNPGEKVSVYDDQGNFVTEWLFENGGGYSIEVDNEYVYVLGFDGYDIYAYNKTGVLQKIIEGDSFVTEGSIEDFKLDQSGNFALVNTAVCQILYVTNNGDSIKTISIPNCDSGAYFGAFNSDELGNFFIALSGTVEIIDADGSLIQKFGSYGTDSIYFGNVTSLSVKNDRLYVADLAFNRIQIFADSNISFPSITFNDIITNYAVAYQFVEATSDVQEPIVYKIIEGDAATFVSDQEVFLKSAGEVTIEASQAGTANHRKGTATAKLTISKALLTFTSDNKERTYGDETPPYTQQIAGFRFDDDASEIDQMPMMTAGPTELYSTGTYFINFEGGSDDNYDFVYDPGMLTINKATLSVVPAPLTKIYGDENPALTFLYDGFKYDDDFADLDEHPTLSTEATVSSPVGDYPILSSAGQDRNYEIVTASDWLSIAKAPLTITIENKTKAYNSPNPELTYAYDGFKNNDDESVIDEPPVLGSDVIEGTSVGNYSIYLEAQGSDNNYEFFFQDGTITITKANQQITFNALPSPVLNTLAPFALEAISDSGLPISYSVSSGPASFSEVVTLSGGLGTVTIEATQGGNENYTSANPVSRSFEVILDPVLGLEDGNIKISVYPNPAKGDFVIQGMSEQISEVVLVDSKGLKTCLRTQLYNGGYLIDASTISEGLYILNLKADSGQQYYKKILIKK